MSIYSNLIDLRPFFEGVDDYVVLKLPEHFPNYCDHADLDILCRNRRSFLLHIMRQAKSYRARGFQIQVLVEHGHWHVDFHAPGAAQLNFRFDLLESLVDYKKFSISPAFEKEVLDYRREILQNGVSVLVPRLTDDLAIRCLEYLAWREVRPDKISHWHYIERVGNWDFIKVINGHTNLNMSVERRPVIRGPAISPEKKSDVPAQTGPFYRLSPTCQIPRLDEIYRQFLGETRNGCFVEVGAFDGEYVSNTSGLADLGWKGFYIEPVPAYFEKCKARHAANSNVTVSQFAIGSEAGMANIHVGGPLSTLSPEMKEHFQSLNWARENFKSDEMFPVRQVTLEDYLNQNGVRPDFELLSIDVEGFEWNVLQNFDIEKWRPQMVIIELHDQNDDYLPMRETCLKVARYFEDHCYVPVYKDKTNTVYVYEKKISGARPRLDYFLIWGHGTQHTPEILDIIRSDKAVQILSIQKKTVPDITKFVGQIYSSDFVPIEHLTAKTRYLLQTSPEVVLVLARNEEPQERFFGEGAFRHIQCQRIKAIKEEIRNRFNPRMNGKRTEEHVIHASDFESQTEHVLKILGLPPVSHFTRRPNRDLDLPYHLPPFEKYALKEVPIDSLCANILGQGVVPITQTPHYQYLLGDEAPYRTYHAAHFGRELTDDHFPENFNRLIADFDASRYSEKGNRSFIVAVERPGKGYQILDGVHRAAILRHRDAKSVLIVEPHFGDPPQALQNGNGDLPEKNFKLTFLAVSKDRPLQLDATLRSWKRHCRDAGTVSVKVLYKASTSRMLSLYRRLMQEHSDVDFVREGDFRRDMLTLLSGTDYVLFVVDDTVFVQNFTVADVVHTLTRHPEVLGFSLRLGRNTTYCYTMNHAQRLPEFEAFDGGTLRYRWPGKDYDFGYSLEVSSSVYRSDEMLRLLEQLDFKNPNTMEHQMSLNTKLFEKSHPFLACWERSGAFSLPVNMVQKVCNNRVGGNAAYSAESLAALFASGHRIQTELFDSIIPTGCHQEVELKTALTAEPVPLVTVIMPCYKQAHYLPEAVASVAAQTLGDWELIIVNDGSPDDTSSVARELMKKYPGQRIILLEKKNGGLAHARNAGIRAASGAYILPLDADDKIEPAMLEKTTALLEGNPGIAIAYTDVAHFGAVQRVIQAAEFDFKKLCTGNQLNYCSLYRREAWELAGGYNSNLIWGYEDWDFWIGCGEQGLVARRIPGAMLHYRVKDSSMYTEAVAHDRELRARIVLNHPTLYAAATLAEAREIWSKPDMPVPSGAPRFSVIVPTHNRPARLEETLRDLARQTFRDFEVIVANDNGLDMEHVINHCKVGVEITFLHPGVNRNPVAINYRSLRRARGRCILSLEENDVLAPDQLEKLVSQMEANGTTPVSSPATAGKPPLVSVILPTHNRPDRLAAALRSISSQTLTDYEIIVVNDAGCDVEAVLAPFKSEQRIECLRHETNKGIAAARNTGLAAARGKYIAYLDDDDLFYPDHLQTLVDYLEAHPGTVAYTDAHCAFQELVNGKWTTARREVVWSRDWDNDQILVDNFVPTLCVMHPRASLEKTGKFDESLGRHEDWDLWIRLSRHFAFSHIRKVTCEFERRQDKSSLTIQGFAPFLKTMTRIHAKYAALVQGRPDLIEAQSAKRAELRRLAHGQAGRSKIKVGVLSLEENPTACAWLRLGSPLAALGALGQIERILLCHLADNRVTINKDKIPQAQIIVVQRSMPFVLPWHVLRAAVKDPSVRIVFELDDALTLVPETNPHYQHFQVIRPQIEAYLCNADLVTVSTPQLKKLYSSFNENIEVLPNTLDARIWMPAPVKNPCNGKVSILFSGTLTHQNDLAIIEKAIELIIQEFGDKVELLFWGNVPTSLRQNPNVKTIAAFTPDYRLYAEKLKTLPVDLALVPLETVPFNQAKSDIKWLEYSACKIPAIFTDIEAYNQSVEHGKTGWLTANTVEAWREAIRTLVLDGDLRRTIAENAHQTVMASRSLEANADLWLQSYETVLASPAKTSCREKPSTSIIIPTFNNLALTRNCLQALQKNTPAGDCEIIVVDNASSDGTVAFLKEEERAGRLKLVLNHENTGFARACNQGARAAAGKYILFLNNDTEVHPGWLSPLVADADSDPAVAAVGAKLLYPDGTIQHAGVALADCRGHDPLLAFHLFSKQKADIPAANERRVYQAVTAACMLVRKSCFDTAGGFDEQYWNGYEDVDLCLRFNERGWFTVYEPGSVVTHHESQSGPERFRSVAANVELFHRKWLEKASPDFIFDNDGGKPAQTSGIRAYSPPSGKLVSILVLAHNQLRDTRQCLASIEKHTQCPYELILVDNGSTDGTDQFFSDYAARHSNVRVVFNQANLGFSAGNNQALACARGNFVLLLNNDTVVTPGWLESMLATIERHPDCGLAGPVSNSVSGPQRVAKVPYSNLDQLDNFAAQWSAAHTGQSVETGRLVGFCLLLRRAVVEKIGALDARFGSGNFEDDDYCLRASLSGFKLRIVLDSFVHHAGGQTFKGAGIDYNASLKRNWELFKSKWALPADASMEKGYHAPGSVPDGLALRLALPDLNDSHTPAPDGRCWLEKTSAKSVSAKGCRRDVVIKLPPCALVGHLGEARELLDKKKLKAAKDLACAAIQARPFHPEAWLLLGRVAQAAGDFAGARRCGERAVGQAPVWEPAKQFLKDLPGSSGKSGWLRLPAALAEKPGRAPRLSVCMIVKNEEQFLEQCLQSVQGLAHQIVVVDTGSTDRTIELAKKFKAEVYSFAWNDDFSAARNEALKHATGDWVLSLDADEELVPEHKQTILEEMKSAGVLGYRLPIINHGRLEEGCGHVPRLFRNAPGLFFVGRVHEQIFSSLEARCKEWAMENRLGRTTLLHHGYAEGVIVSRDKAARNLRLLRLAVDELPGDPNLVMNLGLELIRSGEMEAGLEKYREAVRLTSELPPDSVTPEFCEALLTQLTTNLLAAGRFGEIADFWQQSFPKSRAMTASQHYLLGLAQLKLENPAAAAEQMRQCLAKRSQPALSIVNKDIHTAIPRHCLALSLAALGDPEGAEQAFREALGQDANSRPVRFDFAKFQLQQGRPIEALRLANELVTKNRHDTEAWQFGGHAALGKPEFLEFARDWTGEAIKNVPDDSVIILQRAETLLLNQQADAALPLWTRAHSPNSPRHLAALTLCELLAGRCRRSFAPATEKSVSQEFVKWYRQLLRFKAHSLARQLNEKLDDLSGVLPSAAATLGTAMKQAETAMAI